MSRRHVPTLTDVTFCNLNHSTQNTALLTFGAHQQFFSERLMNRSTCPHGENVAGPGIQKLNNFERLNKMSTKPKDENEKPSRTLFVRNIPYVTDEQEIRNLFEVFGDIKLIFNLIAKRGI